MLPVAFLAAAAALAAPPPPHRLPLCNVSGGGTGQPNPINFTRCGASGCPELPQCSSVTPGGVCIQSCSFPAFPPAERRLMAWVGGDVDNQEDREKLGGMAAVVQQLQTNPGLFDGLYGFCGWAFKPDGTIYIKNATKYGQCAGTVNLTSTSIPGGANVLAECKRQGMDFQPVIGLDDWQSAEANSAPYIEAFAAAAKQHGWKGFNLDWEGSNTTSTVPLWRNFCELMNEFADGLAAHGLAFSTDIQWVTQAYGSKPSAELTALLGAGRARWITMDTYTVYPQAADALDFYATRISPEHLSVGMSCEGPTSPTREGFYGRFEALNLYKITDVTMFMMPTAETWMPWLRKWKNNCAGCPSGGSLSCWTDLSCY